MFAERPDHLRIDRYSGPYERWVYSPELGQPFVFPPHTDISAGYFTALLEGGNTLPFPAGVAARLPPIWAPGDVGHTILPFAFHRLIPHRRNDRLDQDVAELLKQAGKARYRVNFPIRPDAWVPDYARGRAMDGWTPPATRPKAIVAVIDDGIPFAGRAFLDAVGRTRISHCWLQSAPALPRDAVPFGRELVNAEIDALRAGSAGNEAEAYRRSGTLLDGREGRGGLLRRTATHGAQVLAMAAGNGPGIPADPMGDEVQIIAVELPNAISWETSGFGKETYVLSALHYIFDRARRIAAETGSDPAELPLFVNLSYGWNAGRHDSGSALDDAIQHLVDARRAIQPLTQIMMPTGNEFAAGLHAHIDEPRMSNGACRLGWQVQPDDMTCSYLEIWFPQGMDPSEYQIDLIPPHGQLSGRGELPVTPDPALPGGDPRRFVEIEMGGQNIGQLSADLDRGTRWRVLVALLPTWHKPGQTRAAPAGRWTVEVSRTAQASPLPEGSAIRLWVQRDDDPVRMGTGGRQSYLVDLGPPPIPDDLAIYDGRMDLIRGYGGLSAIATAPGVTRVAGYEALTGFPCRYSGSTGISAGGATAPDIDASAPCDRSRLRPGMPSAGVLGGSRGMLSGTSAACPQVTRLFALNCVAGRDIWHGFGDRPTHLRNSRQEPTTPIATAQHHARLGTRIAPGPTRLRL
ncbi:hypothetical protein SAMN05216196_102216 [Lutimaribacter pacificus]|uniref:Subtilase family protein n=1 Tax=Lutimaribacter pacificus TaxID=391948 RepID=A0A1H0EHR3_9RHOB|nr:hypothetical protein [Lutimaribacter pacificus]SDN82027.1 hypothetical protein SAMN05216196_102216 [Lutimaribacter pacificus]SHK52798.1 hypothetical protein SAMN05444142_10672 [Lutimaribacter pacificus]